MGALMRRHDWSASPVGDPAAWPHSLRSIVGLMLNSKFPMFVAWGPELAFLYNDGYRPIFGAKHPRALGLPFREVWSEIWADIEPLVAKALAGEATFHENLHLVMERNGYPEDTWYTFSYSPVRDEGGAVAGMFCACTETTQQVLAERRLRESEENYRHAVDLSPQTVWTARPDGQLDHVGYRWREWTGTSGLGSSWGDVIHPDDLAPSVAAWTRAVETGGPYDIEHRARFRDGSYRWMHSRAYPRRDAAGRIARWYGTTEDIHAARTAEEERRQGDARLRGVLEGMAEGFALLDRDFRIREINAEGLRMEARPREEIVGKSHWEAYPGSEGSEIGRLYKRAMAERVPVVLEHRYAWPDGRAAWLEMRAYPAEDGLAVFYRDVTERKRAEEARREGETRFGAALAIAQLGTFDWNVRTGAVVLDERSRAIFGFAPGEGTRAQEVFDRIDRRDFDRVFAEAQASLRDLSRLETEYRVNLPDGSTRVVGSVNDAIPGADGAAVRMFGVFADATARKRTEARRLALVELSDRIRDLDDPAELSFAAAEILGRTLGVSRAGYGTVDTAAETITIERDWNAPGIETIAGTLRFRDYGSYIEDLKRGETAVVADAEKDPRTAAKADALKAVSAQAFINMPVTEHGGVVALLYLNHATAREWPPEELALVREFAERTRTAVERRRAERELRESEAEARNLAAQQAATLGQLAEGVMATDETGRITLINDAAARLHGVSRFDVAPDAYSEAYSLLTEDGRPYPSLELPLARAVRGETVLEARWRIRRPDGREVRAVGNARPVRDGSGRRIGAVLTVRDDTARRAAEEALERLNRSLEETVAERTADRNRLWQLSTDIMLVARFDGTITAVNPAWKALLGWKEAELIGRGLLEFVHPDDRDRTAGGAKSLSEGLTLRRFENRYRHKDGSYRWIAWTAVPGGGLINAAGRDVTAEKEQAEALRRAEEQLRQSQKMEAVGQLTGGIAHDFNNLLAGITGSLELLQARMAQGRIAEVDRYVTAAQGAAKRAAALTHRLLAFSRRQTLDPKPTDVNRLVSGMEELVRRTVGPEVAVETVAAGGLWATLVDRNQLENALLNLCINSRDAMPDGGKLTIETANRWLDARVAQERDLPPGQYVSLCVSDTGTGMEPDVARRAFDPFFTTKPIGQGTGLGLSMIYGFVRQSGGQARIYSEPGQGTMVCLYLPRHLGDDEDAGAPARPAAEAPPRAEQGETVLVVDDEPTVRMLICEVLEDLGYTAIEAADGPSGLKALRSAARVDLLVTDVGLPGGMNGRQVADAARQLRPGLKVLFITGYAENAVLSHGHLDPGMHVLTKPFRMEALAGRIKGLIAEG